MFATRQPSIAALRDAPIKFRYVLPINGGRKTRTVLVDALTAQAVLVCYDAVQSPETKAKIERMVSGSPQQFRRIVDVAWKHVRIGGAA